MRRRLWHRLPWLLIGLAGSVVRREMITGLLIGTVLAGTFFAFSWLAWGNVEVSTAVSLAFSARARLRRSSQ